MKKAQNNHLIAKIINKFMSREVITYLVAGGLTTLVNFVAYDVLCNKLGITNMVSNTIAWVIAVVFAYVVNNFWVFQSESADGKKESIKVVKFFGARIVTLIVESAGMYIFIDLMNLHRYNLIVKGFVAVIVIILNYIFSKWFVFQKEDK